MKPILQVEHLVKQYDESAPPVIDDISFCVEPGELCVCLGPQGVGKSTLMAILATTLTKTRGRVRIAGCDLDQQTEAIREEIGVVWQKPDLNLTLTAEENIRLHVCRHGLYPYAAQYCLMPTLYRRRIEELTAVVGLDCDLFQPVKTFSRPKQRKLELIRGLLHDPLLLLLDEPTADLDAQSRRDFWRYLRKLQRVKGVTIFLTTQEAEEAEEADHICILPRDRLGLEDSWRSAYKGKQAMNE